MMSLPHNIDPGLKNAMDRSLKAYEQGDPKFFNYVSDDVRIYGIDSSEPLVGRKAFETNFSPTFLTTKRKAVATD